MTVTISCSNVPFRIISINSPIHITDMTIGRIYLTIAIHHLPILIVLLLAFKNSMSLSALNIHAYRMHSKTIANNTAIWLINVSTYPIKISPLEVAKIIEITAPTMIRIVIVLFLDHANLFCIENDKGSTMERMLVRPAR